MARLAEGTPARRIRASHRSLVGKVSLEVGSAAFESSLERDWLELLDFDPDVLKLRTQPFTIWHEVDGVLRPYTPDVQTLWKRGSFEETVVYEVKPRATLQAEWADFKPRFRAATRHCKERGWRFKIVHETHIRTPLLKNAKFLRRYRSIPHNALVEAQLLYSLKAIAPTTPQALLAAAYWSTEARMGALPTLWKLVGERTVACNLDEPLTMRSKIWLAD